MLESHKPVILNKFNGLFNRGDNNSVPIDHAQSAQNLIYSEDSCETRHGVDLDVTIGSVVRWVTYKRPGEASRKLILTSSGDLYDSLNLITPILSIPAMTDFSTQTFFGRIYISPHNGVEGLPGEKIYVYDGTTIRQAGGVAPTGSLTVTTSALSGFVEVGTHLFAVSFETASGFVTKPGPAIYAVYVAPGGFKVDISNIPTGPAGTVARRLLATKVADPFSGDQEEPEYFFIPEGRIANNIDTTLTVDFFDNDLQTSADYLFFQRESIPACLHLSSYKSRLVASNYDGGNSIALLSKAADPESFSELDGFIAVDPASNDTLKSAVEFRGSLYFAKSLKVSGVSESEGLEPAEWAAPESVDLGVGTEVFGIQKILDSEGTNLDKFLIATRLGLEIFNGLITPPALTWKIENFWRTRINFAAANKIQVFNDPTSAAIYCSLPIDGATLPNVVLYGDYSRGFDPLNIRWSIWAFPFDDLSIGMDVDNVTQTPFFGIGSLSGNIYSYPSANYNDNGTAIDSYLETALVKLDDSGVSAHCADLTMNASGVGNLQAILFDENGVKTQVLLSSALTTAKRTINRLPNFESERMYLMLRTSLFNERFKLLAVSFFIKPLWGMRPQ